MKAVTLKTARDQLEQLIDEVIVNDEPIIIHAEQGQDVVMISLDLYNSWKERRDALLSPTNTECLQDSIG